MSKAEHENVTKLDTQSLEALVELQRSKFRAEGEVTYSTRIDRLKRLKALIVENKTEFATTTKRDFSFMGKFLFVGMIVLILAMLANMFLQIPALALTISSLVVVVFSLFLLHDVSRIVTGGETNYIMAATGVYISLFNIFVSLLHLLMALAGQRE